MHVTRPRHLGRGVLRQQHGLVAVTLLQKLDAGILLYIASHSHLLPLLEPLPVLRTLREKNLLCGTVVSATSIKKIVDSLYFWSY